MTYSRVLGTIGLIGATVLGATGQMHAPQPAHASSAFAPVKPAAVGAAAVQQALRLGYVTLKNGKRVYLSSALYNSHMGATGYAPAPTGSVTSSATTSGVKTNVSPPPAPSGGVRANQDFGDYQTGNGQLFHNTESVAVDPLSALHVVVGATDTRLGSDGFFYNTSSNPTLQAPCFLGQVPFTCDLIQALGGPGVYDSVDGARSFTDQIIPDMLSGNVPNAINPTVTPTAVGCVPEAGGLTPGTAGVPTACEPYDSAGDQSVAFDNAGNLYVASLGLIYQNRLTSPLTGIPQTDVVVNVSPAVQPAGSPACASGGAVVISCTVPPNSAGHFFNAPAPTLVCNAASATTNLCLHGEVTASTYATNFIVGGAGHPGRNWQADNGTHFAPTGVVGGCGIAVFCLIDQPYLTIDNGTDPIAYLTYTLFDFTNATSNVYLQVAQVPTPITNGISGQGLLPSWSPPIAVDNPNQVAFNGFGTPANLFCPTFVAGAATYPLTGGVCGESWGAEPAVGHDGLLYIAYENGDYVDLTAGDPNAPLYNAILVATVTLTNFTATLPSAQVIATSFVSNVLDHDAYDLAFTGGITNASPAALDPANGAYFTIPNRPTIAVTGAATLPNPAPFGTFIDSGIVVVAWTDQRSTVDFTGANLSTGQGTRVWYALGSPKARSGTPSSQSVKFDFLGRGLFSGSAFSGTTAPTCLALPFLPDLVNNTVCIHEVAPQFGFVNQFFPWATAAQTRFSNINDNIFVGFYQEIPSNSAAFRFVYAVGKSNDLGATFGSNVVASNMPQPAYPTSAAACISTFGFLVTDGAAAVAKCNATPYFGTYTGIASDFSNGAYSAFTDTRPNTRNFNNAGRNNADFADTSSPIGGIRVFVGSQDVTALHLN